MTKDLKSKFIPFILTAIVILLDQISKIIIVKTIPQYTIGASFFGDFFRIIHVCNTGVAFSVGANWAGGIRQVLFLILPVIVIGLVISVYFRNKDFSILQRWAICGIIGGGIGNLIDRFFRKEGVVDFLDVKFFGIFGLERWPTFNIADSAVVICGLLLIISFIKESIKTKKESE